MNKSILLWITSALLYVGIVMASYSIYSSQALQTQHTEGNNEHYSDQHNSKSEEQLEQLTHQQNEQHNQLNEHVEQQADTQHDSHHGDHYTGVSDVTASIHYSDNQLEIVLLDQSNAPPELEINHEKTMHLIVVSEDLEQYAHLHPTQKEAGVYIQAIELAGHSYTAFVDIKPKGQSYVIEPLPLHIEDVHEHQQHSHTLVPDHELTKVVNGQAVKLGSTVYSVNQSVALEFTIQDAIPEPYLGALGHVVIVDEAADNFVHVHPLSEDQTTFVTTFEKAGRYKLWAEFKFEGIVNVYPFVIDVVE